MIPSKDGGRKSGAFINPIISNPECVNYSPSDNKFKFLFLARLVTEKGVLTAEKILKRVAELLPKCNIEYLVAGSGPLSKQ